MNTVFKVVFNAATRAFTAVSEAAKSKHVSATVTAGVLVSMLGATFANADVPEASDGVAQVTNAAGDLFVDAAGNSSNLHAVTGKVIVHDDALKDIVKRQDTQDQRGNELSDRLYRTDLAEQNNVHYDGDKVVKTEKDMIDKETGTVMRDREGNAIKVAEFQKGSDSIIFRGTDGTVLKNVADGEVSSSSADAVNGSQLSDEKSSREKADSVLQTNIDNANKSIVSEKERATTIEKNLQTQVTSKVDNTKYINDTNSSNQRISKLEGTKASRTELSLVQTQAQSGIKKGDAAQKTANENRVSIKNEVNDRQAADTKLQDNIDKKVDTTVFVADQARQDAKVQANTDDIAGLKATDDALNAAQVKESKERVENDTLTNDRIDTLSKTVTTETTNLWNDKASNADVDSAIKTEANSREVADDAITGRLETETTERKADTNSLQSAINTKADADRTTTRKELNTKVNVDTYMNQLQTDQAKTARAQASADTANASVSRETTARETQFNAGVAAQSVINDQVSSETKRLDSVKADKTQVKDVVNSVDAVATETRANGNKIQSLDSRTSAVETQASANANAINANAARQSEINEDVEVRKADRSELNHAVANQSKVNDEVSQVQTSHGQRINTLEDRQGNTEQAITAVNANAIARDKEVLSDAKSYVDRTRGELNNRIDNVERKAYSGIAASMAMTGLSPVIHANKSAMSVSVGSYASQGAVAVGYSRRFGDDATTLRINGAVADRNFGGAVGLTHEF